MRPRRTTFRPSQRSTALPAVVALLVFLLAGESATRAGERKPGPGFVDGSAFSDLADETMQVVEIHVPSGLLAAVSEIFRSEQPEAAEVITQLDTVNAVIVGLGEAPDPARTRRAQDLVRRTERQLSGDDWERIVRIQEPGNMLGVFIRSRGEVVIGLTVLAFDSNEGQVVFANISGVIDLAQIGRLGETLEIPGLDQIPSGGD